MIRVPPDSDSSPGDAPGVRGREDDDIDDDVAAGRASDAPSSPAGPGAPGRRAAPTLGVRLDQAVADERRRAARALLRSPLLTAEGSDAEVLTLVRRHRDALAEWFMEELGWRLVVENDFARLHKLPVPDAAPGRGLATRSGAPFDPRHYALFCLVLAALDQAGGQTALTRLAEDVRLRAAEIPGLAIDFDRQADRWAFVHAARACADLGAMQLRDGDDERFARGEEGGDALYRVHHRRVAQFLSCPIPPSLAPDPAAIGEEQVADTADARARRARHRIQRRLADDPVLHTEDLSPAEREYLTGQSRRIVRRMDEMFGFDAEQRREGIAAIDTSGEASDLSFPSEGTVGHAALLLVTELVRLARSGAASVPDEQVVAIVDALATENVRYWRAELVGSPAARERLADQVLARLEAFGLVRREGGAVTVRPAAARFAVAPRAPQAEPVHPLASSHDGLPDASRTSSEATSPLPPGSVAPGETPR